MKINIQTVQQKNGVLLAVKQRVTIHTKIQSIFLQAL